MEIRSAQPIKLFISYAHKDEALQERLSKHLAILKRQGVINEWHDRQITAGAEWEREIDEHLNSAQIILLLVSADFLASDYCYGIEMRRALERHARGEAIVIPVILQPSDWEGAPFGKLHALPKNAKPITSWPNRDEAFADVARGIRKVVEQLSDIGFEQQPSPQIQQDKPLHEYAPGYDEHRRRLDAAAPSQAEVGQSIDLLVQVRFPNSPLLGIEDWPTKAPPEIEQASRSASLKFLGDPQTGKLSPARLKVKVVAPNFKVNNAQKTVDVPPNNFSEQVSFLITAQKTGNCRINVEAYNSDDLYLGTLLLETTVGATIHLPTHLVANLFLNVTIVQSSQPDKLSAHLSSSASNTSSDLLSSNAPAGLKFGKGWGLFVGFLIGVLGNLLASGIQQVWFNPFSLPQLSVILLLAIAGLGFASWLKHRPQSLPQFPWLNNQLLARSLPLVLIAIPLTVLLSVLLRETLVKPHNCNEVQIKYVELDLPSPKVIKPNQSITLHPYELSGVIKISGRAVFTDPNVSCPCEWLGKRDNDLIRKLEKLPNCGVTIESVNSKLDRVELTLKVGNPVQTFYFTINFSVQ